MYICCAALASKFNVKSISNFYCLVNLFVLCPYFNSNISETIKNYSQNMAKKTLINSISLVNVILRTLRNQMFELYDLQVLLQRVPRPQTCSSTVVNEILNILLILHCLIICWDFINVYAIFTKLRHLERKIFKLSQQFPNNPRNFVRNY